MSLFYLKNEPHITVIAPIDGGVLPYGETNIDDGKEYLSILAISNTVFSPVSGTVTDISNDRMQYTVIGNNGEKIKVQLNSDSDTIETAPVIGQKITVGEPIIHLLSDGRHPNGHTHILTLILDNSDEFRAITVFEGKCRSAKTEIMSFCR